MPLQNGLSLQLIKVTIELEQPGGGAADVGESQDADTITFEVIFPTIFSRVEESHRQICIRIETEQICTLVQIAAWTGESEIVLRAWAAMLPCDDMLDMKRCIDLILHAEAAILAAPKRPFANTISQL